jgi:segregation and condensation protein B
MEFLNQHIEALIFATEHPITIEEMKAVLDVTFETEFPEEEILRGIELVKEKFSDPQFAFEVIEIANGFQFLTKPSFHNSVGTYLKQTIKKRLSQAALETLSIVAYKQPISKAEMEQIRGVSCDYAIQKLLEKELVEIQGRSDAPGRPLVYGTSEKFMDYFGIKSLQDLPKPKDFKEVDNQIGEASSLDEVVETITEPIGEETSGNIPSNVPSNVQDN